MNLFADLGVAGCLCEALSEKNITVPTAVQKKIIPVLLKGEDIAFRAETGTGKTFAYLLPALSAFLEEKNRTRILIVAPTHELASQIKSEAAFLLDRSASGKKAALFIGGAPIKRQCEVLKQKPLVAVGAPVRLAELIRIKKLKADDIAFVAIDEADRLLSPETREDLAALLKELPPDVQWTASSATMDETKLAALQKMLPESAAGNIRLEILPQENILRGAVSHWAFFAERRDKIEELRKFLNAEKPAKTLVFTSKAAEVQNIVDKLRYKKINCGGLFSSMDKTERKKTLDRFRSGKIPVLVTSDLSARGLDVPGVTHVVQLDMAGGGDFFVHRAGRTGRAGGTGVNVMFGDEYELRKLAALEKKLGITVFPKILHGGTINAPEETPEEAERFGGSRPRRPPAESGRGAPRHARQ